jgi:hypothetical protein
MSLINYSQHYDSPYHIYATLTQPTVDQRTLAFFNSIMNNNIQHQDYVPHPIAYTASPRTSSTSSSTQYTLHQQRQVSLRDNAHVHPTTGLQISALTKYQQQVHITGNHHLSTLEQDILAQRQAEQNRMQIQVTRDMSHSLSLMRLQRGG